MISLRTERAKLKTALRLEVCTPIGKASPAGRISCWLTGSLMPNTYLKVCHISRCFLAYSLLLNLWFYHHILANILVIRGMWKLVDLGNTSQGLQCQAEGPPLVLLVSSWCPKSSLVKWKDGSNSPRSLHSISDACNASSKWG